MVKTTLVSMDVEKGSRILQILDDTSLQVKAALWAFLSDYEDWRLVLSSRKFDAGPRGGYGLYHDALEAAGVPFDGTILTMILKSDDRFVRALRKKYGKAKRMEGTRIYVESFGDRFVEEGYLYRA